MLVLAFILLGLLAAVATVVYRRCRPECAPEEEAEELIEIETWDWRPRWRPPETHTEVGRELVE